MYTDADMASPELSIVIPCYNEVRFIGSLIDTIARERPDDTTIEVILVDGGSDDGTRDIASEAARVAGVPLQIVDNPRRIIPAALNLGIGAARGRYVARIDGHTEIGPNYFSRILECLRNGNGRTIVGGIWKIVPSRVSKTARAIALSAAHLLGSGGATYRTPTVEEPTPVETVPFGAFARTVWEQLDGFDERLLANEDYDFMERARDAGIEVLLDPRVWTVYHARPTFRELARQYYRYGWWKAKMLRKHKGRGVRPRQLIPAAWALFLLGAPLAALLWPPLAIPAGSVVLTWLLVLGAGAWQTTRSLDSLTVLVMWAFAVIQTCWGIGFVAGMLGIGRAPGSVKRDLSKRFDTVRQTA